MKARSLTPAERVGGHPASMHTLLVLCLTEACRRPITSLGFDFVPRLKEKSKFINLFSIMSSYAICALVSKLSTKALKMTHDLKKIKI